MEVKFDYNSGKVDRKFTQEWANSGILNLDNVPQLVQSLVEQRKQMMLYIEALHNKIDFIIEKNHICNIPSCHTANCESDHK